MSHLVTNDNEADHDTDISVQQRGGDRQRDTLMSLSGSLLEKGDAIIYAVVGICFFLGAIFALGYSFWDFGTTLTSINAAIAASVVAHASDVTSPLLTPQSVVAGAIIKLVSDLLLVLIIMEVLGTVTHYLKAHATSLRPFLFIGIISATRGILSIGARLSVESVSTNEFYQSMIELGVNALAILALGITLKLLGNLADEH
jgi:uncharacterized membrane protein (DUF373 family)